MDISANYSTLPAGGASVAKVVTAASTNPTLVKAAPGRLIGWSLTNTTAAVKVVRIYDLAVAPTVGTSVPKFAIVLPANAHKEAQFDAGLAMGAGLSYSVTGAIPDLDATVTAANDVIGALYYT